MMPPAEVATPTSSKTGLGQNDFNFRDHDFSYIDCGFDLKTPFRYIGSTKIMHKTKCFAIDILDTVC